MTKSKISWNQSVPSSDGIRPDKRRLSGVELRYGRREGDRVITCGGPYRENDPEYYQPCPAGLSGFYICDDTSENRRVIAEAGNEVFLVFG
jgi:hypothetical protein